MAHPALLRQGGLSEGLAEVDGPEDRIVAEAVVAAWTRRQFTSGLTLEGRYLATWRCQDDDAPERGPPPSGRDVPQLVEEVCHALTVVQAGTAVAGAEHAGFPAKSVDFESGVVCQRRQAAAQSDETRLQ